MLGEGSREKGSQYIVCGCRRWWRGLATRAFPWAVSRTWGNLLYVYRHLSSYAFCALPQRQLVAAGRWLTVQGCSTLQGASFQPGEMRVMARRARPKTSILLAKKERT